MNLDLASEIEAWFEALPDNGEFVPPWHGYPYFVVGPTTHRRVYYTTKPSCLSRRPDEPQSLAFIGQGIFPHRSDLDWIERLVGDRELVFLGDCDPPALLIYAWLRSQRPIRFCGVSDDLISRMQVKNREHILISLTAEETAALPFVSRILPDLKSLIGPNCYGMLQDGYKIEVEGVVNFGTVEFRNALASDELG